MKKTNQPPPEKILLDVCCGTKMMWVNRKNPAVIFGDIRQETIKIKDRSHGKTDGTRTLSIEPDTLLDFRNLPYKNDSFWHVLFDPPPPDSCWPKKLVGGKVWRPKKGLARRSKTRV